jgi:hypothetical protein
MLDVMIGQRLCYEEPLVYMYIYSYRIPRGFMLYLQKMIPEAILSDILSIKMGPSIVTGFGAISA